MRLENYYTLTTKYFDKNQADYDEFDDLESLLSNIDLNDAQEYQYIEITHTTECYDGTLEENTLYEYSNGKVQTMTKEIKDELKEQNSLTQTKEITYDYDTDEDGVNAEFVIIDGKKYIELDYCRNKLDELEGKFAYECECNKQFVETQDKKARFRILLANAITCLEEEQTFDTHDRLLDYLGMTQEEYNEIMGE